MRTWLFVSAILASAHGFSPTGELVTWLRPNVLENEQPAVRLAALRNAPLVELQFCVEHSREGIPLGFWKLRCYNVALRPQHLRVLMDVKARPTFLQIRFDAIADSLRSFQLDYLPGNRQYEL